ncbi:glycosyltransferase family 25 protein [Arenibacterium sp. CAU 1754]
MNVETFVIHLERARKRFEQAQQLIRDTGPNSSILAAVDGSALSPEEINRFYRPGLLKPAYPFPLRPGEIGCFLSHRNAWQNLVDGHADAALILEDDVALGPEFDDALNLAQTHVGTYGYIQLQTRKVDGETIDAKGLCRLLQPQVTPLRTSGQLVNRASAQRLLDLTETFDRPVDTFLQMHWHTGIHLATIAPSGLTDRTAETGGSTISERKSLSERLAREWKRSRYRAAVNKLSSQG